MSISFANALGIHEDALNFRAQRAEVLANNIANADTPNYKARDLDFAAVLAEQSEKQGGKPFGLNRTDSQHIAADGIQLADPGCATAPRPTRPSTRTALICSRSKPTTPRTRCSSRPASLFSIANSKG